MDRKERKFAPIQGGRAALERDAYEAFIRNDFKAFARLCARLERRADLRAAAGAAPRGR